MPVASWESSVEEVLQESAKEYSSAAADLPEPKEECDSVAIAVEEEQQQRRRRRRQTGRRRLDTAASGGCRHTLPATPEEQFDDIRQIKLGCISNKSSPILEQTQQLASQRQHKNWVSFRLSSQAPSAPHKGIVSCFNHLYIYTLMMITDRENDLI